MSKIKKNLPQEGTGSAGESLPVSSDTGSPSYSGGGKLSSQGSDLVSEGFDPQPTTIGNDNGSDIALRRMEEDSSEDSDVELVPPARESRTVRLQYLLGRKRGRDNSVTDTDSSVRKHRAVSSGREEAEVSDLTASTEAIRSALLADRVTVEDAATTAILNKQVLDCVANIEKVSARSKNLKGEFKRALNVASVSIKEATEALAKRSVSAETRKLQADNDRLQTELEELRKEMAELRARLRKPEEVIPEPVRRTSAPSAQIDMEEMARYIMMQVGDMVNARFKGLENRLLPDERMRPPLAGDKRRQAQTSREPEAVVASYSAVTKKGLKAPSSSRVAPTTALVKPKKKRRKKKKTTPALNAPVADRPTATTSRDNGWTVVGKKRAQKVNGNTQAPKTKLRSPISAAVILTLQPEAPKEMTYGAAIAKAKASIDLKDLGIDAVRFRRALTGATIVEVPGTDSGGKADSLAAKLKELYREEDIRVSRPVKSTELLVTGLDDSITTEEIAAAISINGGCPADQIRVGAIRWDRSGLGATVVRCPITAAKKVANGLKIGWAIVRVKLLPPREMRCYRCLETGHVGGRCTAPTDRSTLCYHCGQPGHTATACTAEPHCVLCTEAGKQANHRLGSKECNPPVSKRDRGPFVAGARAQPQHARPHLSGEVVDMATE